MTSAVHSLLSLLPSLLPSLPPSPPFLPSLPPSLPPSFPPSLLPSLPPLPSSPPSLPPLLPCHYYYAVSSPFLGSTLRQGRQRRTLEQRGEAAGLLLTPLSEALLLVRERKKSGFFHFLLMDCVVCLCVSFSLRCRNLSTFLFLFLDSW